MRLGQIQNMIIVKFTDHGVYLAEKQERTAERVLLPKKETPEGAKLHDRIRVFLYKDSSDRIIATTSRPRLTVGKFAVLKVKEVTRIGAFLDWGLAKDLLLPFKEQEGRVRAGEEILVRLYIDKSERLCASMRGLYELLDRDSAYRMGDAVRGRIYEFSDNFGCFAAVDDHICARIPKHENTEGLRIGQVIDATVTGVKPDGKLDLTIRRQAYLQMEDDAEAVYSLIESYGGVLPFNDKASPETILREAHMSKAAFKRAVGRLYKERRIAFTEKGIRLNM